jgi:hypothetical protein
MKRLLFSVLALLSVVPAFGDARIDVESFASSLGGWKKKLEYMDYSLSGSEYRTYRPEISTTPDGGLFVSIRIDYRRGLFSSDDHAVLELTVDKQGRITTAQSSLAIQGKSVASDVIRTGGDVGKGVPVVGGAVKVGADLTANLSEKVLRENIVESGRVSFPSVVRHNYNLLFQAIRVVDANAPAPLDPNKIEKPSTAADGAKLEVKGSGETKEIKAGENKDAAPKSN